MKKLRAKCIAHHPHAPKRDDPSFTIGKFYTVIDTNIKVMNDPDPWIKLIDDVGAEQDRPKSMFLLLGGI